MAWGLSGSSVIAWFIGVRPGIRLVHPGSLGSLGCVLGIFGFIRIDWGAFEGSSGSSGVAGFIGLRPGVVGFIGLRPGVVGFIHGRWVQWGCALAVARSISGRWVHCGPPRGFSG